MCIKHGAKHKRFSRDGCTSIAKKGGLCIRHGAKEKRKRCISDGCTNQVVKGGVCMRHGAKKKLCSSEGCTNLAKQSGVCVRHGATRTMKRCSSDGCTNQARKGGVCWRHGPYRNPNDESTAFASCFGSEFEKTTATYPGQLESGSSSNQAQGSFPEEVVVVCGVIAENYEEV